MSVKRSLKWLFIWIGLALLFNIFIFIVPGFTILGYTFVGGAKPAMEFLCGYIIELSLSVDNLFLFLLVFSTFKIESKHQHKVLAYGIAGAVIMRLLFVVIGLTLIEKFSWILYIFGIVLIIGGIKMMSKEEKDKDLTKSIFLKILGKIIPITNTLHGEKFLIRQNKKLFATPLLAVLVLIECTDIIFAVDSIPAIFSITKNALIIYTSNIFAILGLRNMYFLLEKLHEKFCFVKYGVGLILLFTGLKLSLTFFNIHIETGLSLAIILSVLFVSVISSAIFKEKLKEH